MRKYRGWAIVLLACVLAVAGAACTEDKGSKSTKSAEEREKDATGRAMDRMTQSQQVPEFDFSEERETLVDVLTVRANSTHGTAMVYNFDGSMRWWCPTIGAPVPSTYQLTNPWQTEWKSWSNGGGGSAVTARAEPTGVYSADSAATWVKCVDDSGTAFGKYAESDVEWTSGVVQGMPEDKRVRVDEITYEFSTAKPEG